MIATSAMPGSPKISTAGVTIAGPSAHPEMPPTANMLMPAPRRPLARDT